MSNAKAPATLPVVTLGTILVLRDEFEQVNRDEDLRVADRLRASKLVQLLDELIGFREKEGARG